MGRDQRSRGSARRTLVRRGGVFWLELELEGRRPVCVLTRDAAIPTLANLAVALITTRVRGIPSEVPLGAEDGLPRPCAISLDNLRTVPKAQLVQPITMLGPDKLALLCKALQAATDC
ncbi:MAG: type II toxin-antitoxin system PemK/MazF family toxin [Solirubrobacteraceae bacterium]